MDGVGLKGAFRTAAVYCWSQPNPFHVGLVVFFAIPYPGCSLAPRAPPAAAGVAAGSGRWTRTTLDQDGPGSAPS